MTTSVYIKYCLVILLSETIISNVVCQDFQKVDVINVATDDLNFTKVNTFSNVRSDIECIRYCTTITICSNLCLAVIFSTKHYHCTTIVASTDNSTNANDSYINVDKNDQVFFKNNDFFNAINSVKPVMIQQRKYGDVSFNKTWTKYKEGFGSVDGDYWVGLETIYNLTKCQPKRIRFEMLFNGSWYWSEYSKFQIAPASDKYRLFIDGYDETSTAGDPFLSGTGSRINGWQFSTKDSDNDGYGTSCSAQRGDSGWWMNSCTYGTPNGIWSDTIIHNQNYIHWGTLAERYTMSYFKITLSN